MQLEYKLEHINESHVELLWAAGLVGVDISPCPSAYRMIGYGRTEYGYGPCCILDMSGTEYVAEPHVTWFPWVGPVDKIANFKWAMKEISKDRQIFLMTGLEDNNFFEHFVRKGLLRKVGHLENIPEVEEVHMYQYKGDNNE